MFSLRRTELVTTAGDNRLSRQIFLPRSPWRPSNELLGQLSILQAKESKDVWLPLAIPLCAYRFLSFRLPYSLLDTFGTSQQEVVLGCSWGWWLRSLRRWSTCWAVNRGWSRASQGRRKNFKPRFVSILLFCPQRVILHLPCNFSYNIVEILY